MFQSATAFNQPIGAWDVSLVTIMRDMFFGATAFNQPIGAWDVSSVTNMQQMFLNATAFNQQISDWDVSSVTNTNRMFSGASTFDDDITGWSPTAMYAQDMFLGASAFLALFTNCGTDTSDATACFRETYPQSSGANDGPAAAWDALYCDAFAAPENGGAGECASKLTKGTTCVPTCDSPNALVVKGVCGNLGKRTPPRCLCTCEDKNKMARFGFNRL